MFGKRKRDSRITLILGAQFETCTGAPEYLLTALTKSVSNQGLSNIQLEAVKMSDLHQGIKVMYPKYIYFLYWPLVVRGGIFYSFLYKVTY